MRSSQRSSSQRGTLLRKSCLFILDTENADGIKEDLIGVSFTGAFFQKKDSSVLSNFRIKEDSDLLD